MRLVITNLGNSCQICSILEPVILVKFISEQQVKWIISSGHVFSRIITQQNQTRNLDGFEV
jgi:hypothetical protein